MILLLVPLGKCVCGQKIYAVKDTYAIAHDEPRCIPFEQLDVIEFLKYVRVSLHGIGDN